jgi:hypothetical protein
MAPLSLLVVLAVSFLAGCAGSSRDMRMVGVSPERRDMVMTRTREEQSCMEEARERVHEGSLCGRYDRRDRSLDAREARRCALARCMQAKGYTSYGNDAPARDGW